MSDGVPRVIHLAETASTNADAMRLALAGESLPLWVSANRQTAGRGRAGRTWVSEPGNLQASVAVTTLAPLKEAGALSLIAGIALIDAIKSCAPLAERLPIRLKWPNDVLIGAAKAGGILVETTTVRGEPGFLAVIGFGMNLKNWPENLGRDATALADHAIDLAPDALIATLAATSTKWLDSWDEGRGFAAIRSAWMDRAGPIGEAITVNTASGPVSATYRGLASSGALLAEIDGREQTISYGDVLLAGRNGEGR